MRARRVIEEQYWTATRKRAVCYNLGYPKLHAFKSNAREDLKGMEGAGYKDLDIVQVVVMSAGDLAEIKRQLVVARKALEAIEDAQTTLGQDPAVLCGVKSRAVSALLEMVEIPERKINGQWKRGFNID